MSTTPTPEKGSKNIESVETRGLVVTQPDRYQGLLETIALIDKVTETMGEDRSSDLGAGGQGGQQAQGDDGSAVQSAREQAIANLPEAPVMREKLATHIQKEIKVLRKDVSRAARRAAKPGAAKQLNDLYARVRRLRSLLSELADASYDVLKRLFVRIFIDKQSVTQL